MQKRLFQPGFEALFWQVGFALGLHEGRRYREDQVLEGYQMQLVKPKESTIWTGIQNFSTIFLQKYKLESVKCKKSASVLESPTLGRRAAIHRVDAFGCHANHFEDNKHGRPSSVTRTVRSILVTAIELLSIELRVEGQEVKCRVGVGEEPLVLCTHRTIFLRFWTVRVSSASTDADG
jgi:hypothetical protein